MKIAVDAMGGDFGPRITVQGALQAAQDLNVEILLVGVENLIKREFDRLGQAGSKVTIIDAPEMVDMSEGIFSIRRKGKSSIRVGVQLVKERQADAFVSMGNTAAVVYISRKVIGALRGVNKPALSLLVPTLRGVTLLLDVGANANCQPQDLEQFALMGKIFMEQVLGHKNPSIALMSIGEEENKGNDLTKQAFERLQAALPSTSSATSKARTSIRARPTSSSATASPATWPSRSARASSRRSSPWPGARS